MTKAVDICAKRTDLLLIARRENIKSPDTNELTRMNADAIALLGHISFEILQRRRDAIKPNVNNGAVTSCALRVPVAKLLFGDVLHTQLNHIGLQIRSVVRPVAQL